MRLISLYSVFQIGCPKDMVTTAEQIPPVPNTAVVTNKDSSHFLNDQYHNLKQSLTFGRLVAKIV